MTDSSSLNALNIGGCDLDEDKGVEMDAMTNGSMLHHESHQGVTFNTFIETPRIVENNDISSGNDKATQEMVNDLMQCPKKWDEEAILLNEDDHANDIKKSTRRTNLNVRNEKAPRVGMVFTTYEELNNYFKQYALRVGFGVAVKQSSFTKGGACRRLVLACSKGGTTRTDTTNQSRRRMKTNCEVMIVAKRHRDGFLYLEEVKLEHNHRVSPSSAKHMRCHKRMGNSMAENIVEHPSQGTNMLTEKERENATEIGKLKLAEGDGEAIHQFFATMKSKEPNFFYSVDLDEHKCLRNVFWANARSMAAYQYFGDVVTLDTTYVTDKYDLPLVSFLGMNHHGHLVLLGCGMVSDETSETYVWLFKAWLRCMLDCPPNAIITDQCKSIQKAVAKVFPRTHHRLCLSQVLKKIPDKLGGIPELKAIKKAIKKLAYDSLRVEEFDENWQKMINTYGLESNEWLKILYRDRLSWVPVFLKDTTFWAGMSI